MPWRPEKLRLPFALYMAKAKPYLTKPNGAWQKINNVELNCVRYLASRTHKSGIKKT
jgi:hypothetical protein